MVSSIINIILLQFSIQSSFTDAQIGCCIFSFSFMLFQRLNDQFFFFVHNVERFFHFYMVVNLSLHAPWKISGRFL